MEVNSKSLCHLVDKVFLCMCSHNTTPDLWMWYAVLVQWRVPKWKHNVLWLDGFKFTVSVRSVKWNVQQKLVQEVWRCTSEIDAEQERQPKAMQLTITNTHTHSALRFTHVHTCMAMNCSLFKRFCHKTMCNVRSLLYLRWALPHRVIFMDKATSW